MPGRGNLVNSTAKTIMRGRGRERGGKRVREREREGQRGGEREGRGGEGERGKGREGERVVRHTATLEIRREADLNRPTHRPMIATRDNWKKDPSANKKSLTRRAKVAIMENDTERRLHHARELEHQEKLLRATDDKATEMWSSVVMQLPPQVLNFSMNAVQDTLPHNANLALWRKKDGLSDACKLCGKRQTLPHILNQCPTALHPRRYNGRHDAVLEVIEQGIRPHLSEGDCLLVDLPDAQPYTFPTPISALISFFGTIATKPCALWNSPSAMRQDTTKLTPIRPISVRIWWKRLRNQNLSRT